MQRCGMQMCEMQMCEMQMCLCDDEQEVRWAVAKLGWTLKTELRLRYEKDRVSFIFFSRTKSKNAGMRKGRGKTRRDFSTLWEHQCHVDIQWGGDHGLCATENILQSSTAS